MGRAERYEESSPTCSGRNTLPNRKRRTKIHRPTRLGMSMLRVERGTHHRL